jgi:hypothetical protein
MRKLLLLLAVVAALAFPTAALAKHHRKPAPDPSFTCSAGVCTFLVEGLQANTAYEASIEYVPSNPAQYGCNTGLGDWNSNADGVYTVKLDASQGFDIECANSGGNIAPGTVTAWLRAGSSTDFNDPPVTLSDGSPALVTAQIP